MFTKYNLVVQTHQTGWQGSVSNSEPPLHVHCSTRRTRASVLLFFGGLCWNLPHGRSSSSQEVPYQKYHIETLWRFQCLVSKQSDEDDSHTMQEQVQGMDTVVLFRCFNKLYVWCFPLLAPYRPQEANPTPSNQSACQSFTPIMPQTSSLTSNGQCLMAIGAKLLTWDMVQWDVEICLKNMVYMYIIWSCAVIRLDNNRIDSLLVHGISQTHLQQVRWQLRLNRNTPFAIYTYIPWSKSQSEQKSNYYLHHLTSHKWYVGNVEQKTLDFPSTKGNATHTLNSRVTTF